jgi:hypothetical protein
MSHCLPSPPPKPAAPAFQIAASSKQTQLITGPSLAVGTPCFSRTAVDVPVDHPKLIQIHNLKPRTGYAAIPMQFRLHVVIDGREEGRTIPVLLQPSFKDINHASTYFMKVIG